MPVDISDKGKNNQVDLHPWFETHGMLKIVFNGDGNHVSIAEQPLNCRGMSIELGHACDIRVAGACGLTNTYVFGARHCHMQLGPNTTLHNSVRFVMHEPSHVTLGADCMVASGVLFMTSDNHGIYDAASGERINPPGDIEIGDHVWIGLQTIVMKGARIGAGAMVGLRSVVNGAVPGNCMAVGSPARVIRDNIVWDRKLPPGR